MTETKSILDSILEVLSTGAIHGVELYRTLGTRPNSITARETAAALYAMNRDGLIRQGHDGYFRLTDDGHALVVSRLGENSEPLHEPILHPGAQALHVSVGQVEIGVQASGLPAMWTLWGPRGAKNAVVSGAADSGVTTVLRGLLRATSPYREVRTWTIDPGRQLSDDDLAHTDQLVDGPQSAKAMLTRVERVIAARGAALAAKGRMVWPGPGIGMPLGLLVITDLHTLVRSGLGYQLLRVARQGRKVGISVVAEIPDLLAGTFGDTLLRDAFIQDDNVFRMRSTGEPLHRLAANPKRFEFDHIAKTFSDGSVTAGLGYLATGKLARAYYLPES